MRHVIWLIMLSLIVCPAVWAESKKGAQRKSGTTTQSAPPGLSKKSGAPSGLEKQGKTPKGWRKGKKKGW